jgi:ketosteroid isomerase-like protein
MRQTPPAIRAFLAVAAALCLTWVAVLAGDEEKAPTIDADREAVEQTLHDCFGWALEKDFELFYNTIADASNFISVTPNARVKFGIEQVKAGSGFWASREFEAITHDIEDLRITFAQSCDVAWFYCVLNDYNYWKGEPANWENVRWTGVVEKREGRWRIVQQHFSWAK